MSMATTLIYWIQSGKKKRYWIQSKKFIPVSKAVENEFHDHRMVTIQ